MAGTAKKTAEKVTEDGKSKALGLAMDQITKQFGDGAIMKLGESHKSDVDLFGSGALSIDLALGGGFPKGRIIEIYGPESSGKTTLTLHMIAEVQKKDPRRAQELDPKNRRRMVRALEIIEQEGMVPERIREARYDVEWVVLLPEREELRTRIETRLKETLEKGLVEEVRAVREYVGDDRLDELGLEYRIVGEYLRGERDEASLLPALTSSLFQYARRQEAWIQKLTGTNNLP
jgi:tRNA A37 N6-isopentenylltransferase MiaA